MNETIQILQREIDQAKTAIGYSEERIINFLRIINDNKKIIESAKERITELNASISILEKNNKLSYDEFDKFLEKRKENE